MKRIVLSLLTGSLVVAAGLTSCGAAPSGRVTESAIEPQAELDMTASVRTTENQLAQATSAPGEPPVDTRQTERPQLIKRASLVLSVDSIEDSFNQVREIMVAQQGDVLTMNDRGDRQRQVSFQLRVPQQNLEATLDQFSEMGTIRSRAITTEDVSSQLVDLQARISNAQKQEEALKEIMSRSGDISDVLEVSRELNSVRQSIEQMTAQQKSLQTQVRYSIIDLSLSSSIISAPDKPAFTRQLANSWGAATSSVGEFTTDLMQLGLWLLAYSPYIFVVLCGAAIARKLVRRSQIKSSSQSHG
ncbi:MAG: DUF4349 domain-containing protein [Cyanobacteria bacterium P01_D01_bin.105]